MWSSPDLDLVGDFDITKLQLFKPIVTSVMLSADSSTILFATEACEVFEISAKDGSNAHGEGKPALLSGHCDDQLRGIAVNPQNRNICVTVGDDMTVRKCFKLVVLTFWTCSFKVASFICNVKTHQHQKSLYTGKFLICLKFS